MPASCNDRRSCGGKGFNQALVLFSAGQQVFTARAMDRDGLALKEMLEQSGVEASRVQLSDEPTGHAIIHADKQSGNSIILYGGAKQKKIHECFVNLPGSHSFRMHLNYTNVLLSFLPSSARRLLSVPAALRFTCCHSSL